MSAIGTQDPHEHTGRFKRLLHWARDHDSDASRRHYLKFGFWSARLYSVLLVLVVGLLAFLAPRAPRETMLWVTLGWCLAWSHIYLWYQGKQIIAFPVVEAEDANKDLLNSVLPAISIGILVAVWFLVWFLHYMGWMKFEFTYSIFGWLVILNAALDVWYDLRVNTRVTLNLSKVPGRVEFETKQPPQH